MQNESRARINEVMLRDVMDDDLSIFFEHQQDLEANRLVGFAPRNEESFATHWITIRADATVMKQTILYKGRVAGYAVSFERFGEREVGYWLGRGFWGKGIATRALEEFLRQVTVRPLCARVAKHNGASLRVLQKCGFTIAGEGTFSNANGEESEEHVLILGEEPE